MKTGATKLYEFVGLCDRKFDVLHNFNKISNFSLILLYINKWLYNFDHRNGSITTLRIIKYWH